MYLINANYTLTQVPHHLKNSPSYFLIPYLEIYPEYCHKPA